LYQEYFWKYAKKTEFYKEILNIKANFSEEDKQKYREGDKKLRALAQMECDCVGDDRIKNNDTNLNINVNNNEEYLDNQSGLFEGLFAW